MFVFVFVCVFACLLVCVGVFACLDVCVCVDYICMRPVCPSLINYYVTGGIIYICLMSRNYRTLAHLLSYSLLIYLSQYNLIQRPPHPVDTV